MARLVVMSVPPGSREPPALGRTVMARRMRSVWTGPRIALVTLGAVLVALVLGGRRSERLARARREEALLAQIAPHPRLSRADRLRLAEGLESTLGPALRDRSLDAAASGLLGRPLRTPGDQRAAFALLSARGLSRLSAAQLDEVFSIRLALAESSASVCVGLWRGHIVDGEVMAALARLPPETALRWFALSREGMRAALAPDFTVPPEDSIAVQEVLRRAEHALAPADRARFSRVIDGSAEASPLEGCATLLDVYRAARTAEPAMRERFHRSMARP